MCSCDTTSLWKLQNCFFLLCLSRDTNHREKLSSFNGNQSFRSKVLWSVSLKGILKAMLSQEVTFSKSKQEGKAFEIPKALSWKIIKKNLLKCTFSLTIIKTKNIIVCNDLTKTIRLATFSWRNSWVSQGQILAYHKINQMTITIDQFYDNPSSAQAEKGWKVKIIFLSRSF